MSNDAQALQGAAREYQERWQQAYTLLNNLLAVVHRDGGHYVVEHGLGKATSDACAAVIEARARVSEAEAERDRLRDKAAQLVPYASHLGNCDLDSWVLDESCSCGLFQLLTALTPKAGETDDGR